MDNAAENGATAKALQLPPQSKAAVTQTLTSAQDDLNTILMALQEAEEAEGAPMPGELVTSIDQVGMSLCAAAQQFGGGPAAADDGGVAMSVDEAEIANALVDVAPEIAKAIAKAFGTVRDAQGKVVKAAPKVAPKQMVELMKELIDDFFNRATKWGPMFADGTPSAAQAAPTPPTPAAAAKAKDARAALQQVGEKAAGRVAKSLGKEVEEPRLDMAAIEKAIGKDAAKALAMLPKLQSEITQLRKSLIEPGNGDPFDGIGGGGAGPDDGELEFGPGENMAAAVRKELEAKRASGGRRNLRDIDDTDE